MKILETERLVLRRLTADDAPFILQLVNEPSWLQHIGDKGVRTLEEARNYIDKGPIEMYGRLGFGLYLVELKASGEPIGMCGLIKRESLEDVDVGYAFLPRFWAKGYAVESASAVVSHGKSAFGLSRIVAITSKENHASAKVLGKLGFRFERAVRLTVDAAEVNLYAMDV
ncbi:MAG: acetyltransferase family protein [Gammaproteobacteria bacterium]|jgi:RimJ/RimL family protein N-acetyltransferase|nr:acetyltransferase family protein [Gammaproteobacteria bacterium]